MRPFRYPRGLSRRGSLASRPPFRNPVINDEWRVAECGERGDDLRRHGKSAQVIECKADTRCPSCRRVRNGVKRKGIAWRHVETFEGLNVRTPRRGVHESVWQLCCLGEFLVISMMHLHSSEVVARCGLDFLCAGYFQRGLSRHMRVRFNAVVAKANSAATFLSPRMRNR